MSIPLSLRFLVFSVEASLTLPHAPPAMFAALASVEASVRWQVGVVGVRRPRRGGPLLLGYYALGTRHTLRARVTAFDPPSRFAYRVDNDAFALDVALGIVPADGGAELTYRLDLAAESAPLRRLLGRRVPRDLARLAHYLERRLRPAASPLSPSATRRHTERPDPTLPLLA